MKHYRVAEKLDSIVSVNKMDEDAQVDPVKQDIPHVRMYCNPPQNIKRGEEG